MIGCGKRKSAYDSRGMTLVEIILVIAVIGLLAGTSVLMLGQLRYANTQKAVKTLDAALDELQVKAMSSKDMPYLYVYQSGGAYYARLLTEKLDAFDENKLNTDGSKLCNTSLTIYRDSTAVTGTDFICVAYTKTGVFSTDTNASKIKISGGTTYTIELVTETGKHFVKQGS